MATKREYLVSLGLAKPTRGKFTAAALAKLAEAEAAGMTFDEPVKQVVVKEKKVSLEKPAASTAPKPGPGLFPNAPGPVRPAPTATAPAKPAAPASVDAKAARAWARSNGIAVGERGRLHPDVIAAFVAGNPNVKAKPAVSEQTAKPVTKQVKIRSNKVAYGLVRRGDAPKYVSEPVLTITSCYGCKQAIPYCTHDAPIMPKWAGGETATFTKPTA